MTHDRIKMNYIHTHKRAHKHAHTNKLEHEHTHGCHNVFSVLLLNPLLDSDDLTTRASHPMDIVGNFHIGSVYTRVNVLDYAKRYLEIFVFLKKKSCFSYCFLNKIFFYSETTVPKNNVHVETAYSLAGQCTSLQGSIGAEVKSKLQELNSQSGNTLCITEQGSTDAQCDNVDISLQCLSSERIRMSFTLKYIRYGDN